MERVLPRTGRSFRELYEEHLPMVYRIAFTYMKNQYDSEDAAQETFVRLMRQERPFESAEHVKAWLIVTVTNVCRDMLRRRNKQELNIEDFYDLAAEPETGSELLDAIVKLPEKYKSVIYLYYYEGYAVKEIGKLLDTPQETVKTWLRRARKALRVDLEVKDDEG